MVDGRPALRTPTRQPLFLDATTLRPGVHWPGGTLRSVRGFVRHALGPLVAAAIAAGNDLQSAIHAYTTYTDASFGVAQGAADVFHHEVKDE